MESDSRDPPAEFREGYALSGKIMLSAIVILFFVIILVVCLHLYARWYLLRARQRQIRRGRNRRTQVVFYVDPANNANNNTNVARGLEETVLKYLPVFVYSKKTHQDSIECAVCLSEFQENETGRILPKCNHSFHIECIDMWFHSHSTCPLCRSPVEPVNQTPVQDGLTLRITETDSQTGLGSSSVLCTPCQHDEDRVGSASTSSLSGRRKPVELMGVTIEVPRRNRNCEGESGSESPSTSHSFRSPMSRMLSFRRMLSRDRRGTVSPNAANSVSCGGAPGTEWDMERGRDETMTQQSQC